MAEPLALFGPTPLVEQPRRPVSPEVRRRERQQACLEAGLHPLSAALGYPIRLHVDAAPVDDRAARRGLRCGGCRFREVLHHHNRSYPKCLSSWDGESHPFDAARVSNGPGTDCRRWWPACVSYQPKEATVAVERSLPTSDRSGNRPAPADGPRPTHDCPGGCGKQVAHELFACRPCWYRLPYTMRRAIRGSHGVNAAVHAEAMAAARDWYASHSGAWK